MEGWAGDGRVMGGVMRLDGEGREELGLDIGMG